MALSRSPRPARASSPPATGLASVAIAAVAFALFAALCSPYSGAGDASEFTLVLATNGVAHPTGYPLYTLFGHWFVTALHAAGVTWAHAANLWSAVGAAAAVGFLHALAVRLSAGVRGGSAALATVAALVPVALFACQPILMAEATTAEINSWSMAWACATAWLFVRLHAANESAGKRTAARVRPGAAAWGLAVGAGVAHHLTSILVSAPLTAVLAWALARRRAPLVPALGVAAAAACLPVAAYGLVAWRAYHPGLVHWPDLTPSAAGVWAHVTGEQYRPFLGRFAPAPDQLALLMRVALPFLAVGFLALLTALVRARGAAGRAPWLGLTAAAALVVTFALRYGVPDPAAYFLPAMALGAAAVAPALLALVGPARAGAMLRLGLVGAAGLLLAVPWVRAEIAGRGDAAIAEGLLRSMWSAVPADSAIVFFPDDRFYHLREYQVFNGEKPAVLVLCPELLLADETRATLKRRFGIDPIAGYPFPTTIPGDPNGERLRIANLRAVMHVLNDHVRVPVIVFDPSVPIVQEMRKRPPA